MLRGRQSAWSDFKGGKGRSPLGFGGDLKVRIHISSPVRNPVFSFPRFRLKSRPLAGKVTCGLNVHTNASQYTEAGVLFEDLRFWLVAY